MHSPKGGGRGAFGLAFGHLIAVLILQNNTSTRFGTKKATNRFWDKEFWCVVAFAIDQVGVKKIKKKLQHTLC